MQRAADSALSVPSSALLALILTATTRGYGIRLGGSGGCLTAHHTLPHIVRSLSILNYHLCPLPLYSCLTSVTIVLVSATSSILCLHLRSFSNQHIAPDIVMFLDQLTFLQPLIKRGRRQPVPTTRPSDDAEHEMSTLGTKAAPRPPLRARLFSITSSRSARSNRSGRSVRSARSNLRFPGEVEEKQSLLNRRRSGPKRHPSQRSRSIKPPPLPVRSSKRDTGPPAPKFKRRGYGRSPKIPPRPTTLQLSRGPEKDALDAQAAELHRKITSQRRRLAADLTSDIKPFPR